MKRILEVISHEATDIEKEAAIAAHAHFLTGRRWDKAHLALGIPSTLFAAVAGVAAFTELPSYITGGVAMLVAALSALSTFLSPGDRAATYRSATTTFGEIRREASLLRDVDAQLVNEGDEAAAKQLADRLRELTKKITEADQKAPAISASAKEQAEKKLGQQFGLVTP
jgi:hypothetical protein